MNTNGVAQKPQKSYHRKEHKRQHGSDVLRCYEDS